MRNGHVGIQLVRPLVALCQVADVVWPDVDLVHTHE